ncbi:lamin tail domain-containing protein [Flammeovirga sp. MY04]|uniref:lamin tail domain-containing protein n=1 Tax=Flammeovirga sp. MY04 TaxID=1191459 RepID=UPI00080613CE|nr:lamin tail domain-containing protein [Flammeovirga sp. MY04]ANQ47583.1 lamin tail domain-containing protein [Flammeovirga sp. MY04]
MKKNLKYIIITFISLSIWGCKSQVGEDNNSDGGQKIYLYDNPVLGFDLYALNYGHREVNGTDTVYYIIPNEVARVKDLDIAKNSSAANGDILSPIKLTAFEELKYFTGLETFRLTSNEFTSLDFSNNTNLREIYMNFNWLDTLKIDSLINLEQLEYQGSNSSSAPASSKISSINLTKNTKLVVLELENHLLNELDVSQNTALDEIRVPDNTGTPITIDSLIYDQLSVREGVARQEPSVELPDGAVVVQDGNFGRALKEQGYGGGPISTGEYYIIPDSVNMITFLDVSDEGIVNVGELSYFTALQRLNLADNVIETLDLSSSTNLVALNIDQASGFSTITSITLPVGLDSLSMNKTGLATIDLSSLTGLQYFIAEQGKIDNLNLSSNTELKVLRVRHTNSGSAWTNGGGIQTIDLSNNSKLEDIYLYRNQLDDGDITWWDSGSGSVLLDLDVQNNPSGTEATFTIPTHIYSTLNAASQARNVVDEGGGGPTPQDPDLFISEYACTSAAVDGFRNTYFEIHNNTGGSIDLSNYSIAYRSNNNPWTSEEALSGTLADGDVYVIGRSGVDPSKVTIDLEWAALTANGDDAIRLSKNGTPIDYVGEDARPTTAWDVAGVTHATVDYVLWRKQGTTHGNTDWDTSRGTNATDSEWIVSNVREDYVNAGSPTDGSVPSVSN